MDKELFAMVGTLVKVADEKNISSVDLYNAILRLIYNSDDWDKKYLKQVVEFQNKYEDEDTSKPENYILLAQSAGEPYLEGILRLIK